MLGLNLRIKRYKQLKLVRTRLSLLFICKQATICLIWNLNIKRGHRCYNNLISKVKIFKKPLMKSSTIAEKLNLQQLMHSLKMLNEESDQSKQQAFHLHFADEDPSSNVSISKGSISNDGGQKRLTEICRKQAHSHWSYGHHDASQISQLNQLREINRKLFQDNQVLIRQCVRMRKITKQDKTKKYECQLSDTIHKLQLQNLECQNQINILRIQNLQLKLSMPLQPHQSYFSNASVYQLIQQLKYQSQKLTRRIQEIADKQKGAKLSNSNTTNATRTSDRENDRMMNNIKIVYEQKIKGLETIIAQQKVEINRLRRGVSPSAGMYRAEGK